MSLLSLIMGDYTEGLKGKLRGLPTFKVTKDNNDVIGLLRSIIDIEFKCEAHDNTHVSTWALTQTIVNTFQNKLHLAQNLDKFMGDVTVTEHTGCGIWIDEKGVKAELYEIDSLVTLLSILEMLAPRKHHSQYLVAKVTFLQT